MSPKSAYTSDYLSKSYQCETRINGLCIFVTDKTVKLDHEDSALYQRVVQDIGVEIKIMKILGRPSHDLNVLLSGQNGTRQRTVTSHEFSYNRPRGPPIDIQYFIQMSQRAKLDARS